MKHTITVFVAECRITNKDQSIDKEEYVDFDSLQKAKDYITKGIDEWDGTGKGVANGQISEQVREYYDPYPRHYDLIKERIYSPLNNGWYMYDWDYKR